MYITSGQGQTTPGDKILMSTETPCHFGHLLWVSKKNLFEVWFCTNFFKILSPGQGLTIPLGRNFDINKNILSLRSCCNFKKKSLKSDFIQFFYNFIHVYSPEAGAYNPLGTKFLMSTETSCHFIHLLQVSKKCLWSLILYNFFHDLIHAYSPRAGADSPQGTKFWCLQKGLITLPIYFKEISWSLILYIFFSWCNTCI